MHRLHLVCIYSRRQVILFGRGRQKQLYIQSTLVISTSVMSNNRLSRRENLILVKHRILISGNKIYRIREVAAQEQFLPFSTKFSIYIYLTKGVKLHVHSRNMVRLVFSSILQIRYVEVRLSRSVSEGPFDFEISRVYCSIKV